MKYFPFFNCGPVHLSVSNGISIIISDGIIIKLGKSLIKSEIGSIRDFEIVLLNDSDKFESIDFRENGYCSMASFKENSKGRL